METLAVSSNEDTKKKVWQIRLIGVFVSSLKELVEKQAIIAEHSFPYIEKLL
jgi:hypothetical protein